MIKKIKNLLRPSYAKVSWVIYHNGHRATAKKILNDIERDRGKLSPKHKKLSKEYAHEVLGWTGFYPWLQVYTALSGEFKEGWIPDNFFGCIVVPQLKGLYGMTSNAKALSSKILNTNNFPDLAYYTNGLFLLQDKVISKNDISKIIFDSDDKIVYKTDSSRQGLGVHFFTKENFKLEKIIKLGNGVFQRYINQHEFFEKFMPSSVATIRITSVVDDFGKVTCRAAYLRIGRGNDTHVLTSSTLRIPIDVNTGMLYDVGYLHNWHRATEHPDTKLSFAGQVLPKFKESLQFFKELHQTIPYCRVIGWDFIIDKSDEIQIMEWNGSHNGIKFTEASQGPSFADLGWERLKWVKGFKY